MAEVHRTRSKIAQSAAEALTRADADGSLANARAIAGFDGFIDSIIRVVDRRRSMRMDDFEPIDSIPDFASRVMAAAGKSANIELVTEEDRFGGNGPLYAGGLGRLGMPTTYIGAVARDDDSSDLLPIYQPFADRCERVIPIAAPGHTDALEFSDGKIMLGKPANVQAVTWDRLLERVGLETLIDLYSRASLIGIVNWTLSGGVQGIWEGLIRDVLPKLPSLDARARRVFIDLSDPAKRTDRDVASALGVLREMNKLVPVTLGLNLSEAERIAAVLGVDAFEDAASMGDALAVAAARIQERAGLHCVVIHPREGASAADDTGAHAWFEGPFIRNPVLSTGAGDHFGAGFSFAQALGLGLEEALAVGCAVSGAYVRDAESPTLPRLVEFLGNLPGAED